ncbi:MAG: PAS domain S-box protein [Gemmatimonadota bacterium]
MMEHPAPSGRPPENPIEWHGDARPPYPLDAPDLAAQLLARLAAIVESSDDAIISKSLDGVITTWNGGAERLFGYTAAEAIGRSVTMLIPDGFLNEEPDILARLRRGERIDHYETIRRRKDGTLLNISLTVSPIIDQRGIVVGASKTARDITARKEAETALRNAELELREADRRKDEFLATLAHELRNPLAPIRNGLQVMKLAANNGAAIEQARAMMERQVTQLVRLVDDLLDISRISRGKIELRRQRVDLAGVLRSAVETSRPLIEAGGHNLSITVSPRPISVDADHTRLAQVFANLLNNAAKYTKPGGRIALAVSRAGDEATVTVQDTGVGIPAHIVPKLFAMFMQVDPSLERSQGGLGIGLALAKVLVELHNGRIDAKSGGAGRGSEFTVRLPALPEVDEEDQGGAGNRPEAVSGRCRVLVVDDNEDSATSLAMVLQLMGNETAVAYDGLRALEVGAAFCPHLVFLDLGMPRLNGYDACRRIREEPWGKDAVVVALTGWGQEHDRRRTAEAGFDSHLVKPVDPAVLESLVAGLRRPHSARPASDSAN